MQVFIGLGSNLENPKQQVASAIHDLNLIPNSRVVAASSFYSSPPMGPQDQPDYINAVVEMDTTLTAHLLLDQLQQIEQKHGRVRKRHWGERTLDLDILVYGTESLDDARLQVPHPGLTQRAFVVYPLAEIAPQLVVPNMGTMAEIMANCPRDGLQQLEKISI